MNIPILDAILAIMQHICGVRTRCNEKHPEGNNDDQITEKEKLNRHRKQANTSSVPKSYGFSTRAAASTASWASRVADSDVKL